MKNDYYIDDTLRDKNEAQDYYDDLCASVSDGDMDSETACLLIKQKEKQVNVRL